MSMRRAGDGCGCPRTSRPCNRDAAPAAASVPRNRRRDESSTVASSNSIPAFALTSGQAMKSFSLFLLVILVSLLSQTPARLQTPPAPVHHLDPLSVAEITAVTEALTKAGRLSGATRVVTIELSEPDKSTRPPARVGRAVLYDWSSGV